MLFELVNLKEEIIAEDIDSDRNRLILHAVDCAIEEEHRLNAMVQEYEERFKWV